VGVLTILSPCILPVLPFAFAPSDQPFSRTGLPILLGMAITFAIADSAMTARATRRNCATSPLAVPSGHTA
jgi:cytochrome c biogenesis protein CcdA